MEYELDCLSTHGLDQGFSLFDGASCHAALAYWIVSPRSATEAMNIYMPTSAPTQVSVL